MKDAGYAHMGVGGESGPDKARLASMAAISSPLLETTIAGATGVLVNITVSPDTQLEDVEIASSMITEEAHPDANIIWGTNFDPDLSDEIRVTIIATGFDNHGFGNARPETKRSNPMDEMYTSLDNVVSTPVQPTPVVETAQPTITEAPVVQQATPVENVPAPAPKSAETILDDDFNDIIGILRRGK
jgi:cell division GTPase FtsZ